MNRSDGIRLRHMLEAANQAMEIAAGKSTTDLAESPMLLWSIAKAIEIVGEAANKSSVLTKTQHPEIPWRAIVAMRNHLIHGYFDMDVEVVWQTANEELPRLAATIDQILAEWDASGGQSEEQS
jgi:uncharacterized protein with HEPN domain